MTYDQSNAIDGRRSAASSPASKSPSNVLVCGATGYVGGRLVPKLLDEGYQVTCLVRSPEKLVVYPWANHPRLHVVAGSVDDAVALRRATGLLPTPRLPRDRSPTAGAGVTSSSRDASVPSDMSPSDTQSGPPQLATPVATRNTHCQPNEGGKALVQLDEPSDLLEATEPRDATYMPRIDAAFYLVHSMISAGKSYAEKDRRLAATFAEVMAEAGCQRIIYLGGLGEKGKDLSRHLHSRREVEEVLSGAGVPTTVLRAAMIIGSGSASFEILRYLVDRLPIMICPKWVRTETQPIAIRDVLRYLVDCLKVPETSGQTLDIGGTDVLAFHRIMQIMADANGLRPRVIIPVPVLTPRLSSGWISLVTPVNSRIARPLAEGLRNRTVCSSDRAVQLMPGPRMSVREAIDAALGKLQKDEIATHWTYAGEMPGDPEWSGGTVYTDRRSIEVQADAGTIFRTVCRIGGFSGYWGADFLWHLRGWMDQLLGGPGLRRGRRHPEQLCYGEAVDFWRVSGIQQDKWLRLHAEMRLPGDAELEFQLESLDETRTRVIQTARFRPRGLAGMAYWYSVFPAHWFVFPTMIRGIRSEAEAAYRSQASPER